MTQMVSVWCSCMPDWWRWAEMGAFAVFCLVTAWAIWRTEEDL